MTQHGDGRWFDDEDEDDDDWADEPWGMDDDGPDHDLPDPPGARLGSAGDALAVLQWYLRAGYPPREVERFTGMNHVELRRLEAGIAAALGVPA